MNKTSNNSCVRTVLPFAIERMFCASRHGPGNSGFLTGVPAKKIYFSAVYNYEKQLLVRVIETRKGN